MVGAPARTPCASCPYRRDVPSGVWAAEEYERLPRYDAETVEQPIGMFSCHQNNGRLCAGWVGCHDMGENFAVRIAVTARILSSEDYDAVLDYESPVPLFESGQAAADHGMADVAKPRKQAQQMIERLYDKRSRKEANLPTTGEER